MPLQETHAPMDPAGPGGWWWSEWCAGAAAAAAYAWWGLGRATGSIPPTSPSRTLAPPFSTRAFSVCSASCNCLWNLQ